MERRMLARIISRFWAPPLCQEIALMAPRGRKQTPTALVGGESSARDGTQKRGQAS